MTAPANCPTCDLAREPLGRSVQGHEMFRCPSCLLQWWDFGDVDAFDIYDDEYFRGGGEAGYDDYYAMRPSIERTAEMRLRHIEKYLGLTGGKMLDAGCGPGFFVSVAREQGWDASGIEISEAAANYARAELGLNVRAALLQGSEVPAGEFDLITLWDVIEHVPDPLDAVSAAAHGLKPGGGFVMTTGDVESVVARLSKERWHLYSFPEHLFFHTEKSLRGLCERSGLEVRAVRREPLFISAGYAVERLAKTLFRTELRPGRNPLSKLMIPANLGDVLTVYAQKSN
jgi:SAM-dependent methyltransferase